jgi:hypothetical protein
MRMGFNGGTLVYNVPIGTLSNTFFISLWVENRGKNWTN